ncbi:serine protease snake-like isoform X2 [Anoplophora glabripennis]|uniref:serine protease snake-like isoform X2 n=1 Tax=Anoplophora glabripennis TaxID=217634 RepID=UPI0008739BA4|nr:serine protease snake-like isoform X2 [Anoplophora glabripennis]
MYIENVKIKDQFLIFSTSSGDKCSLKDGSEGICKLITECPTAVQLTRKKVIPVICGFEETESIVCCKEDEEVMEITRTTTNPVTNRTPGDISKQKCKEYAEYAYEKVFAPTLLLKPHITKRLVCDIPRNRLVVGSSLASRREFPHMALIGHKPEGSDTNWHCGGSLISENFVLTAAQCLFAASLTPPILVRVGVTNKTDLSQMQERTVSEIIIHPEFNSTSTYYDIGLLRFSKNVEFNTYIRPACLQTEKFIPSVLAIASGWGVIGFGEETSNDLLATVLEFYGAEECNNKYRLDVSSDRLKAGIVDDMIICAGISKSERSTWGCWWSSSNIPQRN